MSVVITNVSEHDDLVGLNQYVIHLSNKPVIAIFEHNRSDGLAVCLERAAAAVRMADAARAALREQKDASHDR